MSYLLNRVQVYTRYLYEYVRHAEFASALHAVMYMVTRRSYSAGRRIRSSMGLFETRPCTLDFQYINYAYEIELKRFIQKQEFDVFFDVGACLGEYCIWLGHRGYRCFAFEPVYDSYEMILKNIRLNGLSDKVTVLNCGLGRKHSVEHFQLHATNPGSNMRVDRPNANTQKFEINALDNIFPTLVSDPRTRILMKIDVEGMETEMLQGAAGFLRHFDNITLIIEEKISGSSAIRGTLSSICGFEFGNVDRFNIYARKVQRPA